MLIYLSFEAKSKMLNCIYCKTATFENGKGSEEHVILSALGGRKVSKNINCKDCNNRLGSEIDTSFNELSFISTILGVKTGRKKDAPVQKKIVTHEGENYDLLPGGKFRLSKINVKCNDEVGQESISITAPPNKEQALNKLNQVSRKWDKSIDDFAELKATHTKFYLPQSTKIISEMISKLVQNNLISDEEVMTEAKYNNFIDDISLELTKLICRISSTEVIDLKQPEFNDNNNEC